MMRKISHSKELNLQERTQETSKGAAIYCSFLAQYIIVDVKELQHVFLSLCVQRYIPYTVLCIWISEFSYSDFASNLLICGGKKNKSPINFSINPFCAIKRYNVLKSSFWNWIKIYLLIYLLVLNTKYKNS